MTTGANLDRVDCPGCGASFRLEDLLVVTEVKCPKCGQDWQVHAQDVPGGRCLLDLRPPRRS
jgi:predicted Zn finger-like uncharacterized protein